MHTLQEALPCPFCGKQHTLQVISGQELMGEDQEFWQHSESFGVVCDASKPDGKCGCGAMGGFKPTEEEAIEAWNTRTALAQQELPQKERTDFMAGYDAGMSDAKRMAQQGEPSRPDIIEKLSYRRHERDDMTLDDCLTYLQTGGWHKVHGRTERHMVLQLTELLAAAPAPQSAQGELEKLRAPLIQWHQNMAEVCRDSDGTAYLNHRDTAALLQSAQPVAQPLTDAEYQHMTANGAKAWAGVDPQELRTGAA